MYDTVVGERLRKNSGKSARASNKYIKLRSMVGEFLDVNSSHNDRPGEAALLCCSSLVRRSKQKVA